MSDITAPVIGTKKIKEKGIFKKNFLLNWQLYIFLLPAILYVVVMDYGPMYGVLMGFKDFKANLGIMGSPWVGLKHFERFFSMPSFFSILRNTIGISLYSLIAGFPIPVILALALNSCAAGRFTKTVQTITYIPHFISMVVLIGMINIFFSPTLGIASNFLNQLGVIDGPLDLLIRPSAFPHLYVWSSVWQNAGWGSIIYLSALSGVDPALHEAAIVDGASKFKRVLCIDFPAILPTIIILLILDAGKIMNVGFEKVFLMQNSMNLQTSEVIQTYVYKIGLVDGKYSLSTAINLFNSVVNFILLVTVNFISKRVSETSLW